MNSFNKTLSDCKQTLYPQNDHTKEDLIEIRAHIDVKAGNALFVTGSHENLGGNKFAHRMENRGPDLWVMPMNKSLSGSTFRFVFNKWHDDEKPKIGNWGFISLSKEFVVEPDRDFYLPKNAFVEYDVRTPNSSEVYFGYAYHTSYGW